METQLDVILSFPIPDWQEEDFGKLVKYCGSIEDTEQKFEIEFSCGDGKYLSDFWKWTEGGALVANWPDEYEANEQLAIYDGQVCTNTPPRLNAIKMSMAPEQMKQNKDYRFTVKFFPKNEELVFYINNKERSRRWYGE